MSTWQDFLWALPNSMGSWWDIIWGVLALAASIIMFVKMILHHPFDALLVARSILAFGLFLVALSAVNSGWQRYVPAMFALGGFMTSMLLVTDWCNRKDKSVNLWDALVRWLCGPKRPPPTVDEDQRPVIF